MPERLRFSGIVQGVGFRPTVARVARRLGLKGRVWNDGSGVTIVLAERADEFLVSFLAELPPLADVQEIGRELVDAADFDAADFGDAFSIVESRPGAPRTGVAPDAGVCPACRAEVSDPFARRYRYPFASCTHCGPRFSVTRAIPYDRDNTSLSEFPLCSACRGEFEDESSRHYHAQTTACVACGPKAKLERGDGRALPTDRDSIMDEADAIGSLLLAGEIVAVKGLGGYHLCCDATNSEAVATLRERKRRPHRPFALMARDLDLIGEHVELDDVSIRALESPAAPIVLLPRKYVAAPGGGPSRRVAIEVAPDQNQLGFMLPLTPLHHLALIRVDRPIVCTSGNLAEEPPIIDDDDARQRLGGRGGAHPAIADWLLIHDRPILNRVDDSVVRVVSGRLRVLRRARGYAPRALPMPPGLQHSPSILGLGAELKATVALGMPDEIVLSPHLGDLDDLRTFEAWQSTLDLLTRLWQHRPTMCAVDMHPRYRATEVGRGLALARELPLVSVQHHHAHLAAVLAEHGEPHPVAASPLSAPYLGLALDGLGMGDDGTLWGGELLAFDYLAYERVACFKPVPMLGGDLASRHPWRNLYAHLRSVASLGELERDYGELPVLRYLRSKPIELLEGMLRSGANSPLASSCGRLFDAVAAALDVHAEQQSYEGQAAMALEALVTSAALEQARAEAERFEVYPVAFPVANGLTNFEWRGMWTAILRDLAAQTPRSLIAARFHVALSEAIRLLAARVRGAHRARGGHEIIALSGGCFQNAILLSETERRLSAEGWKVLSAERLPANDGAIALGQVVIAAARYRAESNQRIQEEFA